MKVNRDYQRGLVILTYTVTAQQMITLEELDDHKNPGLLAYLVGHMSRKVLWEAELNDRNPSPLEFTDTQAYTDFEREHRK